MSRLKIATQLLCASLFAVVAWLPVQGQELTAENSLAAIKRAYELSQSADSVEAYTELIQLCEQIAALPIDPKQVTYAKNLASWAYNRRGEAHVEQATALAQRGENQRAAEHDAIALADFNRSITLDPSKWKAYHNRGVSHAMRGDFQAAQTDFSRSLEMFPDYPSTWFNRGEVYFEQGEYLRAIADYTKALEFNPNDAGALSRRGRAHAAAGQFARAIDDFNSVLQLAPRDADTYVDRAQAHAALQQWEQAAADYRQAIRLEERLPRAYVGAAWLLATVPNAELRNSQLALQAAARGVELAGQDNARALEALAAAQADSGNFAQAAAIQRQAIAATPEEQREPLEARLKLFEAGQPYRQGQ